VSLLHSINRDPLTVYCVGVVRNLFNVALWESVGKLFKCSSDVEDCWCTASASYHFN
jgi:hypothetical protein